MDKDSVLRCEWKECAWATKFTAESSNGVGNAVKRLTKHIVEKHVEEGKSDVCMNTRKGEGFRCKWKSSPRNRGRECDAVLRTQHGLVMHIAKVHGVKAAAQRIILWHSLLVTAAAAELTEHTKNDEEGAVMADSPPIRPIEVFVVVPLIEPEPMQHQQTKTDEAERLIDLACTASEQQPIAGDPFEAPTCDR